jgi:hypothetical protein
VVRVMISNMANCITINCTITMVLWLQLTWCHGLHFSYCLSFSVLTKHIDVVIGLSMNWPFAM